MSHHSHDNSGALQFLEDVLRVIRENNGDAKVVEPLLDANTDRLNDNFPDILRDWVTSRFSSAQTEEVKSIATDIIYFGNRILEFPRGNKASNVEIAIACYETVLKFYTREAFPSAWAMTQMNLGTAYCDRIKGEKRDNLEQAIAAYREALKVCTREAFPSAWARTQMNLGTAYRNRIKGEKRDNLEQAIAAYREALKVCTREAFPSAWARTQMNLGTAYRNRIKGEKRDNLEQAIAAYQQALAVYTREAFPSAWARTQNNLGNAYSDRIKGEKRDNLEQAIAAYREALEVCTREAFPSAWAMTQMNLGTAYWDRIKGEKRDNLEQAIAAYQQALAVYTREAFPSAWARTQNNLGTAYWDRIKGEKRDNLEQAIAAYQEALKVYTREAFPSDWARTQMNLGFAYCDRIKGEKRDNLEQAIAAYQEALKVYTREAFPSAWARTQNNLGIAYSNRIKGEKRYNLEQAIAAYREALKVCTREAFPSAWARTQMNLGTAYRNRIKGEKRDNLEQAIATYREALKVYTREAFPSDWAMTQNNLGTAYSNRIKGEKRDNLEQAIATYREALAVRTREAFPSDWAMTQNNLGVAYKNRIKGEKRDNLEQAIAAYQQALAVYTREAFPSDWARTQNNLGIAYSDRIKGEKRDNLEQAIAAYQQALAVYTREAFPYDHAGISLNLGIVYQDDGRFALAYNNYESAITTVELLRGEIISGEESKRKQAEEWNRLYRRMVEVCLELKKDTEAIEYIERSKTRNLVELILERDSNTIFPPEVATQLETLRDEIAQGQYNIQNNTAENPTALAQHLQELREQKKSLEDEYLPVGSGFSCEEFKRTLDKNTAVIEWYITNAGLETFVITSDNLQRLNSEASNNDLQQFSDELIPLDKSRSPLNPPNLGDFENSSPQSWGARGAKTAVKALIDWKNEYLNAYNKYLNASEENKTEWRNCLDSRLSRLAEILHIEEILKLIPESNSHLILIPHLYLHIFPLHALPLTDGSFLCDRFSEGVSYAPSCQLLQQVQLRQRLDFKSLFAIQNPTEDLDYADLEVETISSLFADKQVLSKKQATQTALFQASSQIEQANYLHFSCHGIFNLKSPQDSGLVLHGDYISSITADENREKYIKYEERKFIDLSKCLTLGNLFERGFNLNQCRLVVLSACETGLVDYQNISDEYIGLPSGFLYAGTSSVVSSLWTVNDLSTSFLMIKFIQNLKNVENIENISVPVALNQAQTWLRNATKEDLKTWVNQLPLDSTKKRRIRTQLRKKTEEKEKPFHSPYNWAAFTAVGK